MTKNFVALLSVLAGAAVLSGCATTNSTPLSRAASNANVPAGDTAAAAKALGFSPKGTTEREKRAHREEVAAQARRTLSATEVRIGSPESAIVAKFGEPKDINKSVGSWGVHKQYVYDGLYVYTENGVVTAWQN